MILKIKYIYMIIYFLYIQRVKGIFYYVTKSGNDNNIGTTEKTSWLTIQKAANSALPGSTIYIGPGIYYETIQINVQGNPKDGSIIFTSLISNNRAIISGKQNKILSSDGTFNLIFIEKKSYIQIINIQLTDLQSEECSGIRIIGGGSYIQLRNLLINYIRGGGKSGGAMPITVYNNDQKITRSYLIIDNCTLHDCEPAWSEALTLNGNIQFFQVTNNKVYNMNNIAIDFIGGESWLGNLGVRSGICVNNTVWNIHSIYDGSAAGIYVDGGSNITLEMNEVYYSDIGMEIGDENNGHIATKMIVKNNYLHNNDKWGLAFGGYDKDRGRVTDSLFEDNRLEQNDAKRTGGGEISVSFASGNLVQRNIIKPNEQNIILLVNQIGGLNNKFDYQIYYPYGKNANDQSLIFYWGDTEYHGLKAFQNASKQDLHSIVEKGSG